VREPDPAVRVPAFDVVRESFEGANGRRSGAMEERANVVLGLVVLVALLALLWLVLIVMAPPATP
jgi:hypothetical protein